MLAHLDGMVERKLLRRVAAILFHRRAGFSANGMGVWKVPEDQIAEIGPRMAAVRGVSHCYRRPTYPDWPYSVFTMAHGRSKEECDAVLDGVAGVCGLAGDDRATLYSLDRVQEGAPALLHSRLRGVGGTGIASDVAADTRSHQLYGRATGVIPGGVNSPVRAMARGRPRAALHPVRQRAPRSRTPTAIATSTTSARGAR